MPELVVPTPRVRDSFLEAMRELVAERTPGGDRSLAAYDDIWGTPGAFAGWVARVESGERDRNALHPDWVLTSTRWWVDGDRYLGRIAVRHELNDFLREVGGHVGYDVRPTARGHGHATAMLRAALPLAHGLGIDPALVTCDEDNHASVTVIERCGGVLEDVREGKRRYWVPTSPPG